MANSETISRGAHRLAGRLIAMRSKGNRNQEPLSTVPFENTATAIDFPSMPDTLDLVRGTDYAVSGNPFLPDGLHVYRSTRPMEIPISFKLHAFDSNYCDEGALTLLKIAARLHAFVLPIATKKSAGIQVLPNVAPSKSVNGQTGSNNPVAGQGTLDQIGAQAADPSGIRASVLTKDVSFYPPVTAWLHLIYTGPNNYGISCMGYVKDVAVKLHGPWMRGPNGSINLPSMGEYSFVFVHRPSHNNSYGATDSALAGGKIDEQSSATAEDVKETLYNTWNLVYRAGNYRGFSDDEK